MALWRRFGFWAAADAPRTGFLSIACETAPRLEPVTGSRARPVAPARAAAGTAGGMPGTTVRGCADTTVSGQKTISIAKPWASTSTGGAAGSVL